MRVLVTGGTGFVGAHVVAALRAEGHEVRLLARRLPRVADAVEPLGVDTGDVDIVLGDVTDAQALARALGGVDAIVHAANVYSLDPADTSAMWRVNVDGTRLLLHAAVERGLDPIVYVSSMTALLPGDGLTSDTPLGAARLAYPRTKAVAERLAARLQDDGAPVVITSPASVHGPHDPNMGESAKGVRAMLRLPLGVSASGGFGVVDVRDLALAHVRLLERPARPGRYLMGGHWLSVDAMYDLLETVTGRRLRRRHISIGALLAGGGAAGAAARVGLDTGLSHGTAWLIANFGTFNDADTRRELGVEWRDPRDTLRDTVAWLHATGRLTSRQAGEAAVYALAPLRR